MVSEIKVFESNQEKQAEQLDEQRQQEVGH
jgi:hypothetical protein